MRALKIIEGIGRLGRRFSDAVQQQLVWIRFVDFLVLILAAVFPWSTTAATGLVLLIFPSIWITHGTAQMIAELKRPACALPVALVVLAVIGTSWSVGTPWPDRLHALTKVWKLLWLWPLYLHFQKTPRIVPIFTAYAVSNLLLLVFSSLMFLSSDVNHLVTAKQPGVPLKNYIDQSQGFVFVAVILLAIAGESLRDGRRWNSILFGVGSAVFFGNLAFVNVARTAFFYIPAMLSLVGWRYARRRVFLIFLSAMFMVGAALWASSPVLQSKVARLLKEVEAFQHNATVVEGYEAGGAERLEFWRKSIGFVSSAPIIGHGTGSTERLIADAAAGETGLMAKVANNPHNQTLAVAIQWGLVGCLLLYAMWCVHASLFLDCFAVPRAGLFALIGLVAVVQNFLSSAFNSHLFDFYEGWLYVLTIGIVGGHLRRINVLKFAKNAEVNLNTHRLQIVQEQS